MDLGGRRRFPGLRLLALADHLVDARRRPARRLPQRDRGIRLCRRYRSRRFIHHHCGDPELPHPAKKNHHRPRAGDLPPHPPRHVADREGSDRRRHGVVGRRSFLGPAQLGQAARDAGAAPECRGAGVPRRPGRGAVRDVRRLGDHPRALRPAAARVAVHQGQGLPRHDHPEKARRDGIQRARPLRGGHQALFALARSDRPSCCSTTAPTRRRTTTCRGWRRASRFPALR